jgi:hypothetical protein
VCDDVIVVGGRMVRIDVGTRSRWDVVMDGNVDSIDGVVVWDVVWFR